jgi:hypothetical protein
VNVAAAIGRLLELALEKGPDIYEAVKGVADELLKEEPTLRDPPRAPTQAAIDDRVDRDIAQTLGGLDRGNRR